MGRKPGAIFHEEQSFPQARLRLLTAIPPAAMLLLAIWQVGLGHKWGNHPMSNGGIVGWTIFLWLVYFRLITVKLVTEILPGELHIKMRGLWRSHHIVLSAVESAAMATVDPVRDWGGYGIRTARRGRAYIASGNQGVELRMKTGGVIFIGSRRAEELARAIREQL
ncbi:MAG: hypothetical protein ACRD30_10955 [Bryobacteraceae bacterium]